MAVRTLSKILFPVTVTTSRLLRVVRHRNCVSTFQKQNWYEWCGCLEKIENSSRPPHNLKFDLFTRCEDENGYEMCQIVKRTCHCFCSLIVLFHDFLVAVVVVVVLA